MAQPNGGRSKLGCDGLSSDQSSDTRSPVRISSFAAAATTAGVSMLSAPSLSLCPYSPHALPGGPEGSRGRVEKGGRLVVSDGAAIMMRELCFLLCESLA